jgi:asparagine synthetase B (glutamine-hydrolysing)
MIVYPYDWKIDYIQYIKKDKNLKERSDIYILNTIYDILKRTLSGLNINNLAYSGGIDSTIMLHIMKQINKKINTYTISSRNDHPDIIHAMLGADYYKTNHKQFIVIPNILQENELIVTKFYT